VEADVVAALLTGIELIALIVAAGSTI